MVKPPTNPNAQPYDVLFEQMASQQKQVWSSAQTILQILFQRYAPKSVLDVGCGIGTWLAASREMGVTEIRGVDGPWLDPSRLIVDRDLVEVADLEKPLNLKRRFDLAICLETAEHLNPMAADTLVESLVRHAPAILFSAAIPHQRGPGHVNEQWPVYWAEKFAKFRYGVLDFIRGEVWYDERVLWWYRQNTLLFVDYDWCKSQPQLFREGEIQNLRIQPIAVVLPELFFTLAKKLHELEELILKGGSFTLDVDDSRMLHLKPVSAPAEADETLHLTISSPQRVR